MKLICAWLVVAVVLLGCASVDYRPYEGKENVVQGEGGTKDVVDGVEFWMTGTPPRKFRMIGIATGAIGAGYGADGMIQSSIVSKVKDLGGSAAVLISGNTSGGPIIGMMMGGMFVAGGGVREMQFAIVKYVD